MLPYLMVQIIVQGPFKNSPPLAILQTAIRQNCIYPRRNDFGCRLVVFWGCKLLGASKACVILTVKFVFEEVFRSQPNFITEL